MRYLRGIEEQKAIEYMNVAIKIAKQSCCFRSKCGSVIIDKTGNIIGIGFNSPPGNKPIERCFKDEITEDFVSDRTCCVHAEDRAIRNAIAINFEKLQGARIYFIRLNLDNNVIKAGRPYCTWCSKTALDVGIAEFVLWHEEGICAYETNEYNELSYKFKKLSK